MVQEGAIPDVAEVNPEVVPDQPQQEAFSMDKGVHYTEDYRSASARRAAAT